MTVEQNATTNLAYTRGADTLQTDTLEKSAMLSGMTWERLDESNWRAVGGYSREYFVRHDGIGWRGFGPGRSQSGRWTTDEGEAAAKHWCEGEESKARCGG
jgi:hypothetical protein